jgi:hypoxanthine phosphoribosyltransferase
MLRESFPCTLVSWEESARLARTLAGAIRADGYRPDLVIAIGRGGYVPARVVCDCLLHDMLTSMKVEHWGIAAHKKDETVVRFPLAVDIRRLSVLIVDDVTDTGDTLTTTVAHVASLGPREVRTAVLQHKDTSAFTPDYFAEYVTEWSWIIYPWAVHEDLVGFAARVLGAKTQFFEEIKAKLASRFAIHVDDNELRAALDDLVAMGRAEAVGSLYRAVRDQEETDATTTA